MKHILLVEDEPGLVMTLTDRLHSAGYAVDATDDGAQGLRRALGKGYDLIILDIMLPQQSGLDLCRDLRQHDAQTPVMMLTARGQIADKVLGFKLGADDYLTKPFEMLELLARVEALLRRVPAPDSTVAGAAVPKTGTYRFGNVAIDMKNAVVMRGDQPIDLSALELRLLHYFVAHPGTTLSRGELLGEVWGYNARVSTRTVDVHVAWLRQKIEQNPRHPKFILTVHGVGYKFIGA